MLSSSIGAAPYCELALFHKQAKVLIVTDAVVYIPEDPPEVKASASARQQQASTAVVLWFECNAVLCYTMLYRAVLCHAMLCYARLSQATKIDSSTSVE